MEWLEKGHTRVENKQEELKDRKGRQEDYVSKSWQTLEGAVRVILFII